MAEEKIIKINLGRDVKNTPRWRRKARIGKLLRERMNKLKISQKLNENIQKSKSMKFRIKFVKDDKSTKAEFVE